MGGREKGGQDRGSREVRESGREKEGRRGGGRDE